MAQTIHNDRFINRSEINPATRLQQVTDVVRLDKTVYDRFEEQFRPVQPNESTTAIQVGYALGVQAVLKALRAGLVVG
jgi:hypothetical protein